MSRSKLMPTSWYNLLMVVRTKFTFQWKKISPHDFTNFQLWNSKIFTIFSSVKFIHLYYVSSKVIDVWMPIAQVMNWNKLLQIEIEEVHFQMLVSSGKFKNWLYNINLALIVHNKKNGHKKASDIVCQNLISL